MQSFSWAISVPKLQAAVNVLRGRTPITLDVTFEGLSENGVEFADVLLESHNITVEGKHVVNAPTSEALHIDGFIFGKLDKVTNVVVLWDTELLLIGKTQIESVDTEGLLMLSHRDNINLS